MLVWLVRPLRATAKTLAAAASPHEVALGCAMGMLLGLVPKGNLTAAVLAMLLLAMRANLAAATMTAVLFSWVGFLADPLTHAVGRFLLELPLAQTLWAWLFNLPLAPWTALNNTVVLGNLLLGLWLACPLYVLTGQLASRYGRRLGDWIGQHRVAQLLLGVDAATRGGAA